MSEYLGIYKASVVNNNDPEGRGRVIVNVPQVLGGTPSSWCEPLWPTVYTPKSNEIVWVHFANGDINKPVYFSSQEIIAEKIRAGEITADKLAAQLALVSELYVGSNISITPSNGIYITLNNGGYIHLPSDGSDADFHRVVLRATSAVFEDDMQILGNNNKIAGQMTLAASVKPPSVAPTVSAVYDDTPLALTIPAAYAGLGDNGTYWQSSAITSYDGNTGTLGLGIFSFDKTTGARPASYGVSEQFYSVELTHVEGPDFRGLYTHYTGGPAPQPTLISFHSNAQLTASVFYLPSYSYSFVKTNTSGSGGTQYGSGGSGEQGLRYQIVVTNNVTGAQISNFFWSGDMNWSYPAVWTDGTYIYVAATYSNGSLGLYRYNPDGSGGVNLWGSGASTYGPINLTSLWIGNGDLGAPRVIVNWNNGTGVFVTSGAGTGGTSAVRQTSEEWAVPEYCRGLAWNGSRFVMQGGSSKIWKLSANKTSVSRTPTYTWFNSSTLAESTASPGAATTHAARKWLSVTSPVIPASSDPLAPDSVRVYVDTYRQPNLAVGARTALYETLATGTATAPVTDGFAALNYNSAVVSQDLRQDGNPKINIKASGPSNIDSLVGPGFIAMYGANAPAGWLHCDGASYATAAYPDLFAVIGYTYGGSGANFNVPNLSGRFPTHANPGYGGANSRAIPGSALPNHSHAGNSRYISNTATGGTATRINDVLDGLGSSSSIYGWNTGATGSGAAMDMTPAWAGVIFMIRT